LIKSIQGNQLLKKDLKLLDLSFNKIGEQGINKLVSYINSGECHLEELNLEGNSLGDENTNKLCEAINNSLSHKITLLNVSRNLISDESCFNIANLLQHCSQMKILMISWNHIRNRGASLIVNKLKKNFEMKVFDISWNSIGTNLNNEPAIEDILPRGPPQQTDFFNFEINEFRGTKSISFRKELMPPKDSGKKGAAAAPSAKGKADAEKKGGGNNNNASSSMPSVVSHKAITPFAKELGEYFKEINTELVHLDISHNNINFEDAEYLAKECKVNHRILGIHVDGNEMTIDELGFLHPMRKVSKVPNYYANSQIYYNISLDQSKVKTNNDKIRKIRAKNNCWICEGWRETTFTLKADKIKLPEKQFVKIHLSFENWKPYDTMFYDGMFRAVRMCPPGDVLYFFTVNKKPVEEYGNSNTIQTRDPVVYAFEDEFLKEFNENEVKNNYYNKQTESAVNLKDSLVNVVGNSLKDNNNNNSNENECDGDVECKKEEMNMSFNSNVTQVMGDDLIEVIN